MSLEKLSLGVVSLEKVGERTGGKEENPHGRTEKDEDLQKEEGCVYKYKEISSLSRDWTFEVRT